MGQVHSQVISGAPYNVNPKRLSVREFQCYLNEGDQTQTGSSVYPISSTVLLKATMTDLPGGESGMYISAANADNRPLRFVLDPESGAMIVQLPHQSSLTFRFSLSVALITSAPSRLFFAHASSAAELNQIVTQRQTELWNEVYTRAAPPQATTDTFDYLFVWDAQEDKYGGQPIHFTFFFDQTATSLPPTSAQPRLGFSVWINDRADERLEMLYEPITHITPSSPMDAQCGSQPSDTPNPYTAMTTSAPAPCTSTSMRAIASAASHSPKQAPGEPAAASSAPNTQGGPNGASGPNDTNNTAENAGAQPGAATGAAPSGASAPAGPPAGGELKVPYGVPLPAQQNPAKTRAPRPDSSDQFKVEDGPQFRSAIASMERRVPLLKSRIKQLLKRSLMSRERLQALVEADYWLASGLQEASRYECGSLRPLADWFSRHSEGGLSAIQRQRKVSLNELTTRIVEPLQQFYEYDIKCFEQRKREFEEESSQFYSWTSRYLSSRKEARRNKLAESSDSKFVAKKRAFDVARFDYFSYLSDLTTGLKQQVLLQLFALAAQSLTDSHIALGTELSNRTQPRIDEVVEDIKKAAREWEKYRLEKLQHRKSLLEESAHAENSTSTSASTSSAANAHNGGGSGLSSSGISSGISQGSSHSGGSSGGGRCSHSGANDATSLDANDGQGKGLGSSTSKPLPSNAPIINGTQPVPAERQPSPEPQQRPNTGVGSLNYKEGLLWASNRPAGIQDSQGTNKQGLPNLKWHKYWVVLDGTSLREYTNWKQSVDLHNEPINLLIASVREARNTDRRFCFEVVTPHYKRVYQATSEDDMRTWIGAIHKSIATLLESTDDQLHSNQSGGGGRALPAIPSTGQSNSLQAELEVPKRGAGNHYHQPGAAASLPTESSMLPFPRNNGDRIESLTRKLSLKSDKPRIPPIITSLSGNSQPPLASAPLASAPALMSPQKQSASQHFNASLPFHHDSKHASDSKKAPYSAVARSPPPMQLTPSKTSPFDELLYKIQTNPSNRMCAECRSTRSVEWVSINLLVVLCIECSGAHRSLGSHISKVRSLTLDTGAFTPSLKDALFSVSNELMNKIWEARLPQDRRLTPEATSQARVKYVTEKYVEKQFIAEVERPNTALRRAISERDVALVCAALASRANPNGVSDDDEPMVIHALRSALPSETTFPIAEVLIKNGATIPPVGAYAGLSSMAQEYLKSKQAQV